MDDNTAGENLNKYIITDAMFKMMEMAERNLVVSEGKQVASSDNIDPLAFFEHRPIMRQKEKEKENESVMTLIHCKSGYGRSANFKLIYVCYRYLHKHQEVFEKLNEIYKENTGKSLEALMTDATKPLEDRLSTLVNVTAQHMKIKRPQVSLGKKRQDLAVDSLTYLCELMHENKDNAIDSRPTNYQFIAALVQSTAFKNLMIDLGTYNMSFSQRAKDVKGFFERLFKNEGNWYSELELAAQRQGNREVGSLTHYVNCKPKLQTADQQEAGNQRRQQLVTALKLTVDNLLNLHPKSDYSAKTKTSADIKIAGRMR